MGNWLTPTLTLLTALSLQQPSGTKPFAKVQIANENVSALFDSGSAVNLLSKRFYSKIKNSRSSKISAPGNINLFSASGDRIRIHAAVTTKITIDGESRTITFYVVPNNSGFDALVGTDFMSKNNVILNIGLRRVSIGKEIEQKGDFATSNQKLSLPGHHEATLLVDVPDESKCKIGEKVFIDPHTLPDNVHIEAALTSVTYCNGKLVAPIVAKNMHSSKATVDKNSVKCSLTKQKDFTAYDTRPKPAQGSHPQQSPKSFISDNCDLKGIPDQYRHWFFDLLVEYADIFSRDHLDVGKCDLVPNEIKLKPEAVGKIVNLPPIRQPFHLREVTHSYVDRMLEAGIIQRSDSPFSSPLFLVRKHNADLSKPPATWYRTVHNYREVNKLIQAPSYPMRHMADMIDEVSQFSIFSVLDLSQGFFNQVCHDPHGLTAFSVPGRGHFEYVRTAMGVVSSPAMFQRMMEKVLKGIACAFPYLDDVIIGSNSFPQHLKDLRQTMAALRRHNVKLNLAKAQFGRKEVTYLGYELSNKQLRPGFKNVKAIAECKPPKDVSEIKSFLGMASFFRKCIPRFAEYSTHLSKLTRKDNAYSKGPLPEQALEAFRFLQKALSSRPCITPVNWSKQFIVTVDTSGTAHGAVLSQIHGDTEYPCSYASQMLSDADVKKSAFHRERLGIRWALKHFKPYLIGKEFLIRTDHKPLVSLQAGRVDVLDPVAADILQFAPFSVQYLPGPKMPADYLSRIVHAVRATKTAGDGPDPNEPLPYLTQKSCTFLTNDVFRNAQATDKKLKAVVCLLKFNSWPENPELRSWLKNNHKDFVLNEQGILCDKRHRIFVPPALQDNILRLYHDQMGHFSGMKTFQKIKDLFVWPDMAATVTNYCKSCKVCAQANPPHAYPHIPLASMKPATRFNQRLHIDCITNLPLCPKTSHTAVFVISDAFSGYVMAKSILRPTAAEIARVLLEHWIPAHGVPHTMVSDGGSENINSLIKEITSFYQINHIQTPPGISHSNGIVERRNRTLVDFLRKYLTEFALQTLSWTDMLPSFCVLQNTTVQHHGFTPHFLTYGQQPNNPATLFQQRQPMTDTPFGHMCRALAKAAKHVLAEKSRRFHQNQQQYLRHPLQVPINVGDLVYMQVSKANTPKLSRKYVGPFIVLQKAMTQVEIKSVRENAQPFWCHLERLKKGTRRDPILLDSDEPISPDKEATSQAKLSSSQNNKTVPHDFPAKNTRSKTAQKKPFVPPYVEPPFPDALDDPPPPAVTLPSVHV